MLYRLIELSSSFNKLEVDIRVIIPILFPSKMFTHSVQRSLPGVLAVLGFASAMALAQAPSASEGLDPNVTAAQIVTQMQDHNVARAAELKHFHSVRHYAVEYKGFAAKIEAQMEVDADYDAATGKSFRIVSQSGSKL